MNTRRAGWLLLIMALLATGCVSAAGAATPRLVLPADAGSGGAAPAGVDLLALAPTTAWQSGQLLPDGSLTQVIALPWPKDNDFAGYAGAVDYTLEDGSTRPALHLHPMWVAFGTVSGRYPWVALPPGAVFEAEVGFLSGATNSDGVTFQVYESHYDAGGNLVRSQLVQAGKQYDGRLVPLRIDLAHLAGKIVSIELRVDAGATSLQDWAVWAAPRISGQ